MRFVGINSLLVGFVDGGILILEVKRILNGKGVVGDFRLMIFFVSKNTSEGHFVVVYYLK